MQGVVKWYNSEKGFGFIRPDEGGSDVFVHVTALKEAGIRDLAEGQRVEFDLVDNRGKKAAGNISTV